MRDDLLSHPSLRGMTASRAMHWRHPILVLDTDPAGRAQAVEAVIVTGLQVKAVATPVELLEQASTHPSTVIVIEVPTAGMSVQVLLSTAARMTGVRVMPIVLTSRTYAEDSAVARSLLQQGAVAFLSRPAPSKRWREALAVGLSTLQTESAKIASLAKKPPARTSGSHPVVNVPPLIRSEPIARDRKPARAKRSEAMPRPRPSREPKPTPRVPPQAETQPTMPAATGPGRTAGEIFDRAALEALAERGFKVHKRAIVAETFGGSPDDRALIWAAGEHTISLACVDHTHEQGAEVRLRFSVPRADGTGSCEPRVLGRVVRRDHYEWGDLLQLDLIGVGEQSDYDRLVELVESTGHWSLDWKKSDWALD